MRRISQSEHMAIQERDENFGLYLLLFIAKPLYLVPFFSLAGFYEVIKGDLDHVAILIAKNVLLFFPVLLCVHLVEKVLIRNLASLCCFQDSLCSLSQA